MTPLPLIDAHTHVGADLMFFLQGEYPYALDWPTLVRLGAYEGVEKFVVFPMVTNLTMNIDAMRRGEIECDFVKESVPYAFENRRLCEEIALFPDFCDKAYPLWFVDPSRRQAEQVEALRALKQEYPCSGLKVQATIIRSFARDLNTTGRCLLEFAQENDLPVLIHSSISPNDPWSAAADLLAVVEAWPGIRFNLAHSCRYDKPTLDRIAELPNAWFDCSAHRIHCELAVANSGEVAVPERRFVTDYNDPSKVLFDLFEAYPDKLMWGSDAPFDSFVSRGLCLRSSFKAEADTLHALPRETVERIAHHNILAFLHGTKKS